MAEEIKEYRCRRNRSDKKFTKRKRFLKILFRQTICSLTILSVLLGLNAFTPFKESKAMTFVRNIITEPMDIHPIFKNIFDTPKNIFTKEGTQDETPENSVQQTH